MLMYPVMCPVYVSLTSRMYPVGDRSHFSVLSYEQLGHHSRSAVA